MDCRVRLCQQDYTKSTEQIRRCHERRVWPCSIQMFSMFTSHPACCLCTGRVVIAAIKHPRPFSFFSTTASWIFRFAWWCSCCRIIQCEWRYLWIMGIWLLKACWAGGCAAKGAIWEVAVIVSINSSCRSLYKCTVTIMERLEEVIVS